MPRNPERRARSREADKLRKRARRAIERLEKQAASATDFATRVNAKQRIKDLQTQIANLRATGSERTYKQRALDALEALKSPERQVMPIRILKHEKADFANEIRKARRGEPSALGKKGRERVQLFYIMTRNAWEEFAPSERNERIIEALEVDTLEEAYRKVARMPEFKRVMRTMDSSGGPVKHTDKMAQAYYEAKRRVYRIDTPTEIAMAQRIEFVKAYGTSA